MQSQHSLDEFVCWSEDALRRVLVDDKQDISVILVHIFEVSYVERALCEHL